MPIDKNQEDITKVSGTKKTQASGVKQTTNDLENFTSSFLQQLRLQWQLGDWPPLAALSEYDVNVNDNRAECALYISAACFQLGNIEKATTYKSLAIKWGVSQRDLIRVFVSGVYNNLALASTFATGEMSAQALQHFSTAAQLAMPGVAVPAIIKARTYNQLARFDNGIIAAPPAFNLPHIVPPSSVFLPDQSISDTRNSHYFFDESIKIWRRSTQYDFTYNDGDEIERRILSALKSCTDVSVFSKELLAHQIDWPSEYHLSADRVNLLRPFEKTINDANILELGCGCGAITRFLGESGASVTAVEGSQQRATIAAERCRDLPNVSIVLDKIEQVPFVEKFDVVTLIGVLEYSRVYVDASDPIQHVLERAYSYLKPGGVLIVAIENQLGLKYFAGAPEDHGVGVMSGINDSYQSNTAVTFGKRELERRILNAGFSHPRTHLAFPDHKLPCLIVHPEGYINPEKFDLSNLLAEAVFYDRQGIKDPLFSLESAWPLIHRNGLLADMANSHLFFAHKGQHEKLLPDDLLASYYSPKRVGKNSQSLTFYRQDNDIRVSRIGLDKNNEARKETQNEKYLTGTLHSQLLNKIVQKPGWTLDRVEHWLQQWLDALHQSVIPADPPEGWPNYDKWLPRNYIDAIPRNLIINDKGIGKFIDQEWSLPHPLPLSLILYRGLAITLSTITSVATPADPEFSQRQKLFDALIAYSGHSFTNEDYQLFMPLIEKLSNEAQGRDSSLIYSTQKFYLHPFVVRDVVNRNENNNCVTLYWKRSDTIFCEANTTKQVYYANGSNQKIILSIPKNNVAYEKFRLDIGEKKGCHKITKLAFYNQKNAILWEWNYDITTLTNIGDLSFYQPLTGINDGICLISEGSDPQFQMEMPQQVLDELSAGGNLIIHLTAFC